MEAIFQDVTEFAARAILESSLQHFYVFILIAFRLSGLVIVGPVFSQAVIPPNVRVLMVLSLGLVLTPVIWQSASLDIARHDQNGDGFLASREVPEHLQGRFRTLVDVRDAGQVLVGERDIAVPLDEFQSRFTAPTTLTELLRDIFAEFSLGFLLGLGVTTFLSGLQLAGQLIDQQLGLEFGAVINPDMQGGASVSSQMFFLLGGVCLLVMQPVSGHVMIMSALIETFDAMPVGDAVLFTDAGALFTELVQKSLLLAVQVAAPVMAVMGLVTVAMGFLGHSVPQINQLVVGFPVRSLVGLMILSISLTGVGRVLVDAIPGVVGDVQIAVTSYL